MIHLLIFLLPMQLGLAQNSSCHVYNDNGGEANITEAQFTPQIVVHDRATTLYCEAENFCQIDWLRDGIPMDGFDNLWDFPSDAQEAWMKVPPTGDNNQTLQFDKVFCDAEGMWTCVVSGEEKQVNHTMEIIVTDVPYEGPPIFSGDEKCDNIETKFGEEVTLFCPCSAGNATSEIKIEWFRWIPETEKGEEGEEEEEGVQAGQWIPVLNGTTYSLSQPQMDLRRYCEFSKRSTKSTIGQYLTINSLSEKELGRYRVVATRMDDSKYKGANETQDVEVSRKIPVDPIQDNTIAIVMAVCFGLVILLVIAMSVLWYFRRTDIKLYIKDRYGLVESADGKTIDAYIAYSESDSDINFVVKVLMPALHKAGYVPFVKDIDAIPGETLVEQLLTALKKSRRCILVISPDFLQARHTALQVEVATDEMLRQQSKIIPLLFTSVNAEDLKQVRGLKRILSVLKELRWNDGENAKNEGVFKQLLLRMPRVDPKRLQLPADMPLSSRLLGGLYGNIPYLNGNQGSAHSSQQSLVPEERPVVAGPLPNDTGNHGNIDDRMVSITSHAHVPTRTDATLA